MTKEWAESRKAAFTPIFMVFMLIIIYGIFQSIFVACPKGGIARCESFDARYIFPLSNPDPVDEIAKGNQQDEAKNRKQIAARYSGRLVWVFLAAVGTILCFVAFIYSFILTYRSSAFWREGAYARAILLFVISLLFGLILLVRYQESFMPIMGKVFNATIANTGAKLGMPTIYEAMGILNALTYAASFSLVCASCAILVPRSPIESKLSNLNESNSEASASDEAILNSRLDLISEQMKDLRIVLYIGTFLLIAGSLRMSALAQWSVAYISSNAVEAAQTLNTSAIAVTGGFNTLILAAVYLPAAYILQRRAQLFIKNSSLEIEEKEKRLKDRELTFNFRESLPRLAAILGPLLAGPIGDLVKFIPT